MQKTPEALIDKGLSLRLLFLDCSKNGRGQWVSADVLAVQSIFCEAQKVFCATEATASWRFKYLTQFDNLVVEEQHGLSRRWEEA